jgi:hypothetical protein
VEAVLYEIDTDTPGSLITIMGCPMQGGTSNPDPPGGPIVIPSNTGSVFVSTSSGIDFGEINRCPLLWGYDMAVDLIHTDTGTKDLTSYVEVFSHTPHATETTAVVFEVNLGAASGGVGDLDGTGGNYLFRIEIGGRIVQPSPVTVAFEAAITEVLVPLGPYIVPPATVIRVLAKSPRAEAAVATQVDCIQIETSVLLPGEIADAVWDEPKAEHTTADTFGDYLDDEITSRASPAQVQTELETYDGPTNTEMVAAFTEIKGAGFDDDTDTLEEIRDAIDALEFGNAGPGAIAKVVTTLDSATPIPGVSVWVTTSPSNSQEDVIAGYLQSDASGQVTFYLDEGVYYVWRKLTGRNFTNPEAITVTE